MSFQRTSDALSNELSDEIIEEARADKSLAVNPPSMQVYTQIVQVRYDAYVFLIIKSRPDNREIRRKAGFHTAVGHERHQLLYIPYWAAIVAYSNAHGHYSCPQRENRRGLGKPFFYRIQTKRRVTAQSLLATKLYRENRKIKYKVGSNSSDPTFSAPQDSAMLRKIPHLFSRCEVPWRT